MSSAQYFPLKAVFYGFYDVIYRHCESIVVLECCYLLEKKRLHRFIKPQLFNFHSFQPGELLGSCLGFDLISASALSNYVATSTFGLF